MGPKCPKWVQKGVPKWVPQRSEPKKVEKYFFSGPTMGGYTGPPPLKTRFCRGSRNPNLVFADFRKKVRISPRKDGPAGGKSALFFSFENRRKWGLDFYYLPEKVAKGGGVTPPMGDIRAPPPPILYLYNFFWTATTSPKMVFLNPVVILGLKKHHFGARAGTRKKKYRGTR